MKKNIKLDKAEDYLNQLSKKHIVPKPKLVVSYVSRSSWLREMVSFNKTEDSLLITVLKGRKTIPIAWLDVLFEAYLKHIREHYGIAG